VKAVADTIGVARSNLVDYLRRPERPRRGPYRRAEDDSRVAREKRRTPRNAVAFWDLQVFAFARLLSARGEKLANPLFR
jgi:hypothetical protein